MDTSKIRSFIIYLFAAGIGIGAGKLGFDYMTVKFSPKLGHKGRIEASPMPAPAVPAAQPAPDPAGEGPVSSAALAKAKKPDSISYILTGVYLSGNKAFALVNNQIVEEGDEVAGAKVFKINLDEVILKLTDGQAIKLTTRSRYP
ncbi:MAG: hypothetical protein WC354_04265 [Candidatus Omnitrophota bacterium]